MEDLANAAFKCIQDSIHFGLKRLDLISEPPYLVPRRSLKIIAAVRPRIAA